MPTNFRAAPRGLARPHPVSRASRACCAFATRLAALFRTSAASAAYAIALLALASPAKGGVTPEVSRVVFPEQSTEESLQVFNVNRYPVLVQAWIDNGDIGALPQDSKAPIIVLPPIFRMDPGDQINVRLINSGSSLPADRESLFWLNLYEIPASEQRGDAAAQTVTVTMRTQIKVFARPAKLPYPPGELPKRVTFALVHRAGRWTLNVGNPTPYYATFGTLRIAVAGAGVPQTLRADMVAPFSQIAVDVGAVRATPGEQVHVQFTLLDDDGNPVGGEREVRVPGGD